ncbi:MAG TPA: enoyl-CoA hydratase/isomerase family protein [Candidatus Lokiarchaeia archaeon]|nr:enoyl-CoA hydratase/isomerase family protein [Candidatus Lokiarchaeia archaeon]
MAEIIMEKNSTGDIATIWLNRVEKRNALNYALLKELDDALDALSQDAGVRVVLLRAKGQHFSSGIDLSLLAGQDPDAPKITLDPASIRFALSTVLQPIFTKIMMLEKPVIAIVDGMCLGSGFELTLACDFRYATKDAYFQMKEALLGIICDLGGTTRVCRLVNPSVAKEVVIAARKFDGVRAGQVGLVNGVADTLDEAEQMALDLANDLMACAPLAVGMGKRLIDTIWGQPDASGLVQEGNVNSILVNTKDFTRGLAAMMEKSGPPKWKGK